MKKTLKLVPALCMLLISAMVLGTSTYAWFSMNTTVYANGLQVKATTDGALYINNDLAQPAYQDIILGTVSWSEAAAELRPTSTVNLSNWYYVSAERADNYEKDSGANFRLVEINGNYFLTKRVYIRSENNFDKLVVTGVTITPTYGNNSESAHVLDKSITVAFNVDHYTATASGSPNTPVTPNPVFIANEATTARHGGVANVDGNVLLQPSNPTFIAQSTVGAVGAEGGTPQTIWTRPANYNTDITNYVFAVDIFVYFDGQSESCYSNALLNAITLEATINVSFSTANNPAVGG